jgi:integrase
LAIVFAPPETAHVEAVIRALPARYRLPVLALDATGARISELVELTWGDIDEHAGRWRVRADTAKTGIPRWIDPVDPDVHAAVCSLTPREDRDLSAQVFPGLGDARLRVAITRACKATGTPHTSHRMTSDIAGSRSSSYAALRSRGCRPMSDMHAGR